MHVFMEGRGDKQKTEKGQIQGARVDEIRGNE